MSGPTQCAMESIAALSDQEATDRGTADFMHAPAVVEVHRDNRFSPGGPYLATVLVLSENERGCRSGR